MDEPPPDARLHTLLAGLAGLPEARTEVVVHGSSSRPPGGTAVLRAVVLPDAAHPRLVAGVAGGPEGALPPRRALARSVAAYGALRPLRVRAGRAAVAGMVAAGRAGRTVSLVAHGAGVPPATAPELVADRLRAGPVLWLAGVRADSPWSKPTLQLFDLDGNPTGYAKLAGNPLTDAMVRNEASALRALGGRTGADLQLPRLLLGGDVGGRPVCVTAPLPSAARRPPERALPAAAALAALAAVDAVDHWRAGPLAARLGAARPAGSGTRALAEEVATNEVRVPGGWWHGDWVPWNLAVAGHGLWAFDWEYAEAGAPAGLDLVHHAFQRALVERARTLDEALAAAATVAAGLHRHPRARRLLVAVHRLVLALRCEAAMEAGLGPDPALAPLVERVPAAGLGLAA